MGRTAQAFGGERNRHFSGGTGSVPDCGAGSDRENVAVSTAASPVQHGRVLCCLHAFFKWDWLGQVLYTLCLPGTVLALLFPDWVRYPAIHFITIQGFTFHAGIVLYVICQLLQHNIIPRLAALWKVIVFLLVVVPPVYLFDIKFHANYMFVNVPSPGSPLEWLASFLGNPGYLAGYAVLMLLCMVLMDAGYRLLLDRKSCGT